MNFRCLSFLSLFLVSLNAAYANAAIISVPISLDGSQEVAPVTTTGTGFGTIDFDTDTKLLSANITFSDLMGSITAAHFHGAASPGSNASAFISLIPVGGASGSVTGSGVLNTTQEQWLYDDLIYVNIHSTFAGGGEIRGQVVGVPEPSSIVLAILSVIGIFFFARRYRHRLAV